LAAPTQQDHTLGATVKVTRRHCVSGGAFQARAIDRQARQSGQIASHDPDTFHPLPTAPFGWAASRAWFVDWSEPHQGKWEPVSRPDEVTCGGNTARAEEE